MEGKAGDALTDRARNAAFDERVALVGLLLDSVRERVHNAIELAEALKEANSDFKGFKDMLDYDKNPAAFLEKYINSLKTRSEVGKRRQSQVGDRDVIT